MTQTAPVQQMNETDSRRIFLRALYGSSPAKLYLELRCIHPTSGEVRTLWAQMGNRAKVAAALKEAAQLNDEGYGVYFAPCLRRERKGNAASAAWVPALWIDIDSASNSADKERDFERLKAFDLAPSFIIDSGGGWHGYWLLDTSFELETDADREQIASIMRGLFSALGGDPDYVKTVAGIMRLPDSINTKPERNNARGQVIESYPDRRYKLDEFAWLEVKPAKNTTTITHNGNGHHPLPPRTEQYLASGATNGNRNAELFAAACQMRDAGYSQSDAERDLISRYVADGNGSENPASREKEARATITSVFKQPAREPILTAQDRISHLIGQYHQQNRPTASQITEAVQACARLNPVEWAEERQRLKAICGEGLKLSDLDRLYRDSRKQIERAEAAAFQETEIYAEVDGKMIYQRQTSRGVIEKSVADWSAQVVERVSHLDDDGQMEHVAVLKLQRETTHMKIDVPSEVFGDDAALRRFIAGQAGEAFTVRAGMAKHLTPAILSLSGTYPTRTSYRFMGWTQIDNLWTYITPEQCVTSDGVMNDGHEVELETRLRDYGVKPSDWNSSLSAFEAMTKVFPVELAPTLIAFACLPLFQRFFPDAAYKPALHLVGTTGSGKSEIASLMASLYGSFSRDAPPAQWGDTINTVEALGYQLSDALYWVDDYKHIYADERTFTRFMQSYSRKMGRGRLTREAKLRQDRPCRGHILSTGETTLEGEPSVLARMIVLDLPPWEQRDPSGQWLIAADRRREHLSGFTAHLAAWITSQLQSGELSAELVQRLQVAVEDYRGLLRGKGMKSNSTGRVIGNWAVLTVVYEMLKAFLASKGCRDLLPEWRHFVVENAQSVQEERASQLYIDIILQLSASGKVLIEDLSHPNERDHAVSTPLVGYISEGFAYIIPDIAYREVCKVQAVNFTLQAIGNQLKEDGLLIAGPTNLSVQKRFNGQRVRVWQFPAHVFS